MAMTPRTSQEKANDGPKTPATLVDMDKPRPIRRHGPRKYETDSSGRTTRTMDASETWGR
jgi:hypothetical protein